MGVVAGLCSRVIVMYAGRIVEEGPVPKFLRDPQHPYTWSLLQSIPRLDSDRKDRLLSIDGPPPDLIKPPSGLPLSILAANSKSRSAFMTTRR